MSLQIARPGRIAIAACLVALAAVLAWGGFHFGLFGRKPVPVKVGPPPETASLQGTLASIVTNYRKIIVLLDDEKSLEPDRAADANNAARSLFYKNLDLLKGLGEKLSDEIGTIGSRTEQAVPPQVAHFLDELENEPDWHDGDKLVFVDTIEDIIEAAGNLPEAYKKRTGLMDRIEEDKKALKEIQALYDRELEKIFGRFETRGMVVHREAWGKYVSYLKTKFTREQLLEEYAGKPRKKPVPGPEKMAPASPQAAKAGPSEFPPKSLVLTFDDGPHLRYTPRIMEILKSNGIKGVFFELGSNIGSFKDDDSIRLARASKVSEAVVASGFYLGNHSYSHAFLPKLGDKELKSEIERTARLLAAVTDTPIDLFRPPYGAQNERVLRVVRDHDMRSVLWQIDSRDWADPVPMSIADRVVREVAQRGRGVVLFHDINARTVEALPLIVSTLKQEGYRFLSWNGKAFSDENRGEPPVPPEPKTAPEFYRDSWAVVIGIDAYLHWPQLQYAVNDAKAVKELLVRKYRFKPDNIIVLLNEEATRENILSALGDVMGDTDKVNREDRVFVFFAGHGMTRKLPTGRDLGYIIPVDADPQSYQGRSISMTNFQDISEAIPAKHLFFVMDSCYSGLALTRGSGPVARSENYLRDISRRVSRQMLTAGGADQQVADNGPNGHSVFTWTLLQGLEGQADLNNDGFITASELAAYVGPAVSAIGKQTPAFGSLAGSEGGEFIFQPRQNTEFLSELSVQLDQEAIELNSQLDQVRRQIAEKRLRNKKLQKELALAMAAAGSTDAAAGRPGKESFAKHMEKGSSLFKERKYDEALKEFLAASRMNPSSPLAANNAGYMYHKMGQYEEAAEWFEKTIALDPQRAIAHGNLGDAYFNLNRKAEAKKAFLKYLELAPNSKNAPEIENRLKSMEQQ